VTAIAEYRRSRELFLNLTLRELRAKYRRSVLGWTWSTINPLATMAVYTVVFGLVFRARPDKGFNGLDIYALWLLCGLLPWNFFNMSVMGSISGVTGNAGLIKKTYFPRELIPASATASSMVMHLIEMALLTVVLVAFGNYTVLYYLPVILFLIFVMALFGVGLGLLLSSLNVLFRDVEHFTTILFLVWFYLTPIIYPPSLLAKHRLAGVSALTIAKVNPMTDLTACFRNVMYYNMLPGRWEFLYSCGWAVVFVMAGLYVFNRLTDRFAEEL
jgi:ABC-type polysaccharide/polyol phosphate export permease